MAPTHKECLTCKELLPLEAYHRTNAKGGRFGRVGNCKVCRNAAIKARRESDPALERARRLRSKVWCKYGLTQADVVRLEDEQGGVCKICGQEDTTVRACLHIDHCHVTGKVRGLLCHHCNVLLGHSRDNIDILKKAIQYLENSRGG